MASEAEDTLTERTELVRAQAERWAKGLIDLGPHNTLLHFANTKTTSLDLTNCQPSTLDKLFAGTKIALQQLFNDPDEHRDACKRARNLHRKIRAFSEEQGVEVGKLAYGLIRRPPPRVGRTHSTRGLRAPLLLRPVTLHAKTASESDFTLQLDAEVEFNPVLLYALEQEYGIEVDVDSFLEKVNGQLAELVVRDEQIDQAHRALAEVTTEQGVAVELERSLVVGLFNYEKLPMVEDLRAATGLLAEHELVAAMAGYQPAANEAQKAAEAYTSPAIDELHPHDEFLVQDADSSQHRAIETALAGQHVLIEGPPGTGKSQTIANIIAGAAARGQSVLFVAEKRAAIEAVTDRLAEVDLDDLVFDLHRTNVNKRHVAAQLQGSLDRASREPPVDVYGMHQRLADRCMRLNRYSRELHAQREPWGISAYQVQEELLSIDSVHETGCAVRGRALAALDARAVPHVEEYLKEFVELGGQRMLRRETPWWQASVRDTEEVRRVLWELDELTGTTLHRSQDGMRRLLEQAGLPEPRNLAGWQEILELLDGVSTSVQTFGPEIFGEQLDDMYQAAAPRSERRKSTQRLSWRQRRVLVKQVREACRLGIKKKSLLHAELAKVVRQRDRWREIGGPQGRPSQISGLAEVMADCDRLRQQLAAVAMCARLEGLEQQPTRHVEGTLNRLRADRDMVFQLPKLRQLHERFTTAGLGRLIEVIAERNATAEQARLMFRRMWLRCLDDELKLHSSVLREFSGEQQSRLVDEFQDADIEHRQKSVRRVRRKVANALRKARDDYPVQTQLLRKEASKKSRHLPLRKLVERAPDVLLALRPCWAMSPLVVSKTLPVTRLFDLVIFDEASQIQPHDAITSMMRGRRLAVAGDDKQLPPSRWFDRMLAVGGAPDDETDDLGDFDSILTTMRPQIPHFNRLRWHYRSRDERLIAFSNKEMYGGDLVTFPGTAQDSPIRLEVVDGVAPPGQDGSSDEEVRRVVELVVEHAEQRPQESLGVIALGTKHEARIEREVQKTLADRRDLDGFFSEDAGPTRRFFVKNLETVQGDERDAIILSVGVAKRANGVVARTGFGPLNREGGERRLNVAVTRARRRMTVVSSFAPSELAPSDKVNGTELLRRYLEAAQRGGDVDAVGRSTGTELNGFEEDIARRLAEQGVPVYPQWGFSGYRVDFALAHRDRPGLMVLAVEADGDTYHRMESARDRDRLRQAHLERLGWRFHRVWASAWFADPGTETRKVVDAWEHAMVHAAPGPEPEPAPAPASAAKPAEEPTAVRRGPRPDVPPGLKTHEYTERQLIAISRWLMTDGLPLDREERVAQALCELGFQRRGSRIVPQLRRAVEIAQDLADKEEA